jgi:hypothetical protein
VHPASGRTVFHLATSVTIPLFEVEQAEFARQVGASPRKQIVLVLDRAGWHASLKLRVPDHSHLLFLPRIRLNSSRPNTCGRSPILRSPIAISPRSTISKTPKRHAASHSKPAPT